MNKQCYEVINAQAGKRGGGGGGGGEECLNKEGILRGYQDIKKHSAMRMLLGTKGSQ